MSDDEEIMDQDEDTPAEETIAEPAVTTKYKDAADIANRVLAEVVKLCVVGAKIVEVCATGDKMIEDALSKVYNKAKIEKGVAFPTSVSVNHVVGHFSPLNDDTTVLQEGDLAKVDLGVQIDGFIAVVAHSLVVTTSPSPITGRKADVICAAHFAAEVAHKLIRPGVKNTEVTQAINKVAEQFKCNTVEGVLSHQLKKFVIDGNNVIIGKETLEHKVAEFEFGLNEVYAIDIVMSTGDGKTRSTDTRTTVFKRVVDRTYRLKLEASRYVYNEINTRFPTFPFTLRALDEKKGKLGITEMIKHDLLYPYPVLYEKQGEFVAQFKFTVLILPSQTLRITSHQLPYVKSEFEITDESTKAILASSTKRTKKKKPSKKKTNQTGTEEPMETDQ